MTNILFIGLFIAGFIEQFFAVLYGKCLQKNLDISCSIVDFLRGLIYVFFLTSVVTNIEESKQLALTYITGGAIGTYFSLKCEPFIAKRLLKIKNRGRKKTRWFLQGEKKQ
jgi:hypothetical protein